MTLYRGDIRGSLDGGWTNDFESAKSYAAYGRGVMYSVEFYESDWNIAEVEGYDHDADYTPADDEDFRSYYRRRGVDVLLYDDEDERGREHLTYLPISAAAYTYFAKWAKDITDEMDD